MKISELPRTEQPVYRINKFGAGNASTLQLLVSIGRFNDLETAQALLCRAGRQGLIGLINMSASEMQEIPGIGAVSAAAIQAALQLSQRLAETRLEREKVSSPAAAYNVVKSYFLGLDREHLVAIPLNNKNDVLGLETIHVGALTEAPVSTRDILKTMFKHRLAAAFIIAHNHPTGDPDPSPEDMSATRHLSNAGEIVGLELLDHIIVGDNRFISLKETYPNIFEGKL